MYRKIRLGFLAIILLLFLTLDYGAEAQLNFSTGWGKRGRRVEWGAGRNDCAPQARPTFEQLQTVYRVIQAEARRLADCQKLRA